MPTNEERREAARKLRECRGGWSSGECYYDIIHELGLPDTSMEDGGNALYSVLADLIEPEPERTCTVSSWHYDTIGDVTFISYELSCGHEDDGFSIPHYCPYCGAKVVDE